VPFQIRRVEAAETFPLRHRVLRPHERHDALAPGGAGASETFHFAAMEDGTAIGSAAVTREPPPWAPDHPSAWRLRGMATADNRRREGIGAAVLEAVVEHVRRNGGGLLWCNARAPAVSFYERAGFKTRGEGWVDPIIGPHVAMELILKSTAPR
jgi:GNAT superfamily N-acetyltransferase